MKKIIKLLFLLIIIFLGIISIKLFYLRYLCSKENGSSADFGECTQCSLGFPFNKNKRDECMNPGYLYNSSNSAGLDIAETNQDKPQILSLSPDSASSRELITIIGKNLAQDAIVEFDYLDGRELGFITPKNISTDGKKLQFMIDDIFIMNAKTGVYLIKIKNGNTNKSNDVGFTILYYKDDISNWKTYVSDEYGFSLAFPLSWGDIIPKFDGVSNLEFEVFSITVETKEHWEEMLSDEFRPMPNYLGENDQYVFGYTIGQDMPTDKMSDFSKVISTFKII